jgi:methyltransferase (TIGR00027 family)
VRVIPRELHRSRRPSTTAEWTTIARAAELRRPPAQRIVTDEYARWFLGDAARIVVGAARFVGAPLCAIERYDALAVITYSLCRHRFIDDHLDADLHDGVEQVLILGAGYDSRAYRFAAALSGRPVHEVDLPPLSRRKADIVSSHPEVFGHTRIRRVEIDFRTQSLAERLLESGFAVGARTFVVWEGVSPYLDRAAVEETLATLHDMCGSGSTLAMDFYRHVPGWSFGHLVRDVGMRAFALVGEPLTFPIDPEDVGDLLGAHGFAIIDRALSEELALRYATDGRPSERAAYVIAAHRR